jgi:hypothetical protein
MSRRDGANVGFFCFVKPVTVCHVRTPIVHGSRGALYGQNPIWFGLNPHAQVSAAHGPKIRVVGLRSAIILIDLFRYASCTSANHLGRQ